ncbi:hypothetical protein JMUB6875_28860 [Nocardia sp. JMUB6875]|uniref:hypothetical protein n=1 Tax=Nocardia sp. JMUB6875 TaxID=3158170 RepID=UPI0032E7D472
MVVKAFSNCVLLTVVCTGIGVATAQAVPPSEESSVHGSDDGVSYTANWPTDLSNVAITLDSGRFAVAADTSAVDIVSADGKVSGTVPMVYRSTDQEFRLVPQVNPTATTLTIQRPITLPVVNSNTPLLHDVSATGAVIGAAIGCVVGVVLGIPFFIIGALPGCALGGLAGGVIGSMAP